MYILLRRLDEGDLSVLLKQMEEVIREFSLLQPDERIVVGVSGGPDSIALLDGLHRLSAKYGWRLFAVHVNHQLRGEEAEADARFVRAFCRERRIGCDVESIDVQAHLQKHGGNLQAVARELRYGVFRKAAKKYGASKLALGHHADDRVETVLMRFLRGSGTHGLAGIPVKREWMGLKIVRPLWRTRRKDIEAYCVKERLAPRFDTSNMSFDYVRNRVRLELIPKLESYNPQFKSAMLQLSEQLAAEEAVWEKWTNDALKQAAVKRDQEEWVLSVPEFVALPTALQRRVIQLILSYLTVPSWTHTEKIRSLACHHSPSARCSLSDNWEAVRDYDLIRFCRKTSVVIPQEYEIRLNVPGVTMMPPPHRAYFKAVVTREEMAVKSEGTRWAVFDVAQLEGDLMIRSRKPGDRIHILGMKGSKKVKDLFIDEKISRNERQGWPLVTDEADILWIPGLRRSAKAVVTKQTRERLYLFYGKR